MPPNSDELEDYNNELKSICNTLSKLGQSQNLSNDLITSIFVLAKKWLRLSSGCHSLSLIEESFLDELDDAMLKVLECTKAQTRASSYLKKIQPIASQFTKAVIVPVIMAEGSPPQVAARKLISIFEPYITNVESPYIDEAARCMILECKRAALIMLWSATIARIHKAIVNLGFIAFNEALSRTKNKHSYPFKNVSTPQISSYAELQLAKDFDIIVIGIELWNYDVQAFDDLNQLLITRNNAAHPGTFEPSILDVEQFAIKLENRVFKIISV